MPQTLALSLSPLLQNMNSLCVNVVLPHWFNSDFIGWHIIFGCLICNNNYYNSASKDKSTHWLPQQARLLSQQSGLMLLESCNGGGGGITVCPSVLLAFSTFWNVPTLLSPVCLKCCSLKRALPLSLFLSLWSVRRYRCLSVSRYECVVSAHLPPPPEKIPFSSLLSFSIFR